MGTTRRATRRPATRGRMKQMRITRAEINALVRRLDTVERQVSDLRAIAVGWIRQTARAADRSGLQSLQEASVAGLEETATRVAGTAASPRKK